MLTEDLKSLPRTRETLERHFTVFMCGMTAQMKQTYIENLIREANKGKLPSIREPKEGHVYFECDLPVRNGKRKKIHKKTRLDVLKEVYLFFYGEEYVEKKAITFGEMWLEWMEYRNGLKETDGERGYSTKTIQKSKTEYVRYFKDSKLPSMKLKKITVAMLNDELIRIVREGNIPQKSFNTMHGDLSNMYERAIDKEYIASNPMKRIDKKMIRLKCTQSSTRKDEERILNDDEVSLILEELHRREQLSPENRTHYAIELALQLGVRVGELSALKWCDVDSGMIHIQRSEHARILDNGKEVYYVGDTKTRRNRDVPLNDDAMDVLKRVRALSDVAEDDYIFIDYKTGERIKSNSIACCFRKMGAKLGLGKVSIHRVRRTVESKLVSNGVSVNVTADWLGHSPEVSLNCYVYNQLTKPQQREQFTKALRYEEPCKG